MRGDVSRHARVDRSFVRLVAALAEQGVECGCAVHALAVGLDEAGQHGCLADDVVVSFVLDLSEGAMIGEKMRELRELSKYGEFRECGL